MAKMKTKKASGVDAGLIWLVGPAQTWLSRFELYELTDPKLVQYNLMVWKYTFKWVAYVCDRLFNGTYHLAVMKAAIGIVKTHKS